MTRIRSFIVTTLLGGFTVILPIAILFFVFNWLFGFVRNLIQPLTNLLELKSDIQGIVADILVILIILHICFLVGFIMRTRFGHFVFTAFENGFLKPIPGYNLVKETVIQMIGNKNSPFSRVALSEVFDKGTMVTSFITDSHEDGSFTVFVPTGPNPTSGFIVHLPKERVHPIDVPVEDAMRSVISCGSGSQKLIEAKARLNS